MITITSKDRSIVRQLRFFFSLAESFSQSLENFLASIRRLTVIGVRLSTVLHTISSRRYVGCTFNLLSRTVLHVPWSVSAFELTRSLHGLPVKQRIRLTELACFSSNPNTRYRSHLLELLSDYQPARQLNFGDIICFKTSSYFVFFITSLFYSCPLRRNSLEPDRRSAPSLASFESRLKTALFSVVSTQ